MTHVSGDTTRCAGTAMCVSVAPKYFTIDTPNRRVAVLRPEVSDADLDDIEEAVELCPVSALRLV